MSATSSRNRVPPIACSNRPILRVTAPVNAPFSWPNSSLSSRFSGIAAQLTATNRPVALGPWRWTARATTSLPVPDSPWISTVLSVGATCLASCSTSRNSRDLPIGSISPERSRRRISCLSCLFSDLSRRTSAARRHRATISSLENGFCT